MRRKRQRRPIHFAFFRTISIIFAVLSVAVYFYSANANWDGKSRLTVVLVNEKGGNADNGEIAILSVEPQQNRGVYILIKGNMMMDIPYGYKSYPAYSVYKLGQLDDKRGGGKLLKNSIETTFGIKTDRFIHLNKPIIKNLPDSEESFYLFKKEYFNFYNGARFIRLLFNGSNSDLTVLEKIRFYQSVSRMKMSQIKIADLSKSAVAISFVQPDNSGVFNIDSEVFDHQYADDFQNINVRRQEYTLEVQNATGIEKIAGQFARILNTLGAYVILKTTATNESDSRCQLILRNNVGETSSIVRILKNDYHCSLKEKYDKSVLKSDILVIIGKDFLK